MSGSPSGFREFFELEFPRLRDFAYVLTGSWSEAEELAQEAMVRTFRAWPRIRERENPGVYVRAVLVNRRRTLFRRSLVATRTQTLAGADVLRPTLQNLDDRTVVWNALSRLPARQRAAIVLRYYEDFSEAQTAAVLVCPVGTVKSMVHRGLTQLRELLDESDEIPANEGEAR